MEARMVPQAVLQNLQDAGCGDEVIERYCELETQPRCIDLIRRDQKLLLSKQRRALLDDLHRCQRRIDCLDYLLYQMKQKTEHDA